MEAVTIPAHLNGPPGSGHGGASAGMLAEASGIDHRVVTLVAPPPLDVVLAPHRINGGVEYRDGDRPGTEARSAR